MLDAGGSLVVSRHVCVAMQTIPGADLEVARPKVDCHRLFFFTLSSRLDCADTLVGSLVCATDGLPIVHGFLPGHHRLSRGVSMIGLTNQNLSVYHKIIDLSIVALVYEIGR